MSWFTDKQRPGLFMKLCYNIIKSGKIPRHVALIMDGNRRFAKRISADKSVGHTKGFDKVTEVLQWCFELDIKEVTVYAFSIENFKRSEEEVNTLMKLAKEKFDRLYEERDLLMKHGVRVQLLGDLTLIPEEARKSICRIVQLTQDNTKHTMNVAMAYTSRHEMTQAIRDTVAALQEAKLQERDVSQALLEKCFYSSTSSEVDLLIRTSGEVRLSNFMLYQSSHAVLVFLDCLWPEMTVWHFFYAILKYQLGHSSSQETKELSHNESILSHCTRLELWENYGKEEQHFENIGAESLQQHHREIRFLHELESKRRAWISSYVECESLRS